MLRTLGLFLLAAVAAMAAPPPGVPAGWSDGYVYANGIRIHYYHATPQPGKPAIVMAHGVTDIGLCWTTLTWKLQDRYDVYMPDARGHGLSDPFTSVDNGDTLVKDLVAFVQALHLKNPILMGHSMGAATVMRVGAEYPDLARAIVMLDPFLLPGGQPGAGRPPKPASSIPGRFSLHMAGTPEELVAQNNMSYDELAAICRRDNPKWNVLDCEYWALSKIQYHGAYSEDILASMSGTMKTGDALARIAVPALILKADAPAAVRQENYRAASVLRHGELIFIDGAGHNLHHDQLVRTVEVLNAFLARLQ